MAITVMDTMEIMEIMDTMDIMDTAMEDSILVASHHSSLQKSP